MNKIPESLVLFHSDLPPLNEKYVTDEQLYLARVLKFVLTDLITIVYDETAFDSAVDEIMRPFINLNDAAAKE